MVGLFISKKSISRKARISIHLIYGAHGDDLRRFSEAILIHIDVKDVNVAFIGR
jgi:hypothetical protein